MVVEELLYTKEHQWVKIADDIATVGITDYAQQMLGEITFVELPAVDEQFQYKAQFATIESTKATSDIYSPVTGKVTEVNSKLEENPELINQDCYEAGWICKFSIADDKSIEDLMNAKQYEDYIKELQ